MKKTLFYQPQNAWVGDLIPYSHDGKLYLFYLHDRRIGRTPDEYAFRTSWNLLTTTDGTDIEDLGVAIAPGGYDDPDYACYTGSVIQGKDGLFHLFYTAVNDLNPKYHKNGRALQMIMQATSTDLVHWEKHYDSLFCSDCRIYEPWDWRDPYVFYVEEEDCYYMLNAARIAGTSDHLGGCTGLCKSRDLWTWTVCEPFFQPNAYMTHECPDLFHMGDWYYFVYSTFSERFTTHYRMAKSLQGPWIAPVEDTFDARAFYAAKTAELDGERWTFAWIPTKRGDDDFGQHEWGGTLSMHKLTQQPDGRLTVCPGDALIKSFDKVLYRSGNEPLLISGIGKNEVITYDGLPETCMIEADISYEAGIRNFGLCVRSNEDQSEGYYFRVEPYYNRVVFDLWPRRVPGVNQWYIHGDIPFQIELERPIRLPESGQIHLRLITRGDILLLYVNDEVALTTRGYNLKANTHWGFFAFDGVVTVENVQLRV